MPMRHGAVALLLALLALAAFFAWPRDIAPAPAGMAAGDASGDGPVRAVDAAASEGAGAAEEAATGAAHVARTSIATGADSDLPWMRVRVVDADGAPIEGATVQTFADTTPGERTTDADGWCTLPVRAEGEKLRLLVRAGERHRHADWERMRELRIELPWHGPLLGRLVDDLSGAPVAGATIVLEHASCRHCEPDRVTTHVDGTFTFASLPRAEDLALGIEANGYPAQHEMVRLPGRGEPLEHTLRARRGVVIAGRCVDAETLEPIAGAQVGERPHTTTDTGGGFRMLVLPAGRSTMDLLIAAPDYPKVSWPIPLPQPDPTVEFRLPRGAVLSGTVRSVDGSPIGGARVHAWRDSVPRSQDVVPGMPTGVRFADDRFREGTSDAGGCWRIAGLRPGLPYRVQAMHDEFQRTDPDRIRPVVAEPDGSVVDLVLVPLGPTGTITGIYLCNGEPGNAWGTWKGPTREGAIRIRRNGTFRTEGVECGTVALSFLPYAYQASEERDAKRLVREVTLEPGQELDVRIEQAFEQATVRGTLRYSDGTPAAGVWVRASTNATVKSGDDGAYVFRVIATQGEVVVAAAGGEPKEQKVAPGAEGVDFVLPCKSALRFRILAADGNAHLESRLLVRPAGAEGFWNGSWSAPDPAGFRACELPPGEHTVVAVADGYGAVLQSITLATEPVERTFTLPVGIEVALRPAEDAEPAPERLSVRVHEAMFDAAGVRDPRMFSMGGLRRSVPFAGGTVRGLTAGRHRLIASDPKVEIVPAEIDVQAGTSPTFELRWRRKRD